MSAASAHRTYLDGSPFYAALYRAHGGRLTLAQAQRIAANHYTTLDALARDEGLKVGRIYVNTLALVEALGY